MFATSSQGEILFSDILTEIGKCDENVVIHLFLLPESHRHHGGLQSEQDSQSDRGGGGALHRQQPGHTAHHVPAGGSLPHTYTLLQHTLVVASSHTHTHKHTPPHILVVFSSR